MLACGNEDRIIFVSLLQDGITKTGGAHVEHFSYFTVCLRVLKYNSKVFIFKDGWFAVTGTLNLSNRFAKKK